ncbi:MAG: hypothetical protein BGO01_06295 [Armatimonadetes bacterium 55-13]|nr:hypothetical protein [Armatimonadota bacterium]OJU65092.1 MAG: hypothetical protein BGO01_06295 [Armatimonadetes bacterium 55-13]
MRPWSFGKPKTPGFGIQRSFYLTILSSRPVWPPILTVINPKGEGGAVTGFGAPLADAASKDALGAPMERGAYVIASKDRKTVLEMLVMSKEEAGFDPEPFLRSQLAQELDRELLNRIRATWLIAQLTFKSHDPMVYPAVDFLLEFSTRLADLTDGVVADPISRRYLLPPQVRQPIRADEKIDARDVVGISHRAKPDGIHLFTLGMQKFAMPEFELSGLEITDLGLGEALLLSLCQTSLMGRKSDSGDRVGAAGFEFEIREGGFDRGLWEGIPVFELLPPPTKTAGECLRAWQAALKNA